MAGTTLPDGLAAPARRALLSAGIEDLEHVAKLTENELMELHGIGVNARRCLKAALMSHGMSLRLAD